MGRRRHSVPSRDRAAARLFRWLLLLIAGAGGGMLLGELAVGGRTGAYSGEAASFSRLSANPDAVVADGEGAPPCLDCADSYGVGVRMRADRADRMSGAFRELGAVEVDPPAPAEIEDSYRYGGRFPDPEPPAGDDGSESGEGSADAGGEVIPPSGATPAPPSPMLDR